MHERISLITTVFSDHAQIWMVGNLSRDDAQNFIDMVDEVGTAHLHLGSGSADSCLNLHALSIRYWIVLNPVFAGGACVFYTRFVAAMPCFRDHW